MVKMTPEDRARVARLGGLAKAKKNGKAKAAKNADPEVAKIQAGLEQLLVGSNKALTVVAALSIAVTTAHMIGIPKLELQKMLMRMYAKREAVNECRS